MKIFESIDTIDPGFAGCAVTIGNFDGVHLGHQEIFSRLRLTAERKNTKPVAVTFEPHPVTVLYPEKSPGMLTHPSLKKQLLKKCGLSCLVILKTNVQFLNLSASDFLNQFILRPLRPAALVEGDDFNFGYRRDGDIKLLEKIGAENNFTVQIVPAKKVFLARQGQCRISSTLIRHLLNDGRVAEAASALGRNYRLIGKVEPGRGKGRQLGFPTANINPVEQIVPAEGVYAGFVETGLSQAEVCTKQEKSAAVFSIGKAKTLGSNRRLLVEAHILDKKVENLYGKWLAMDFVTHIRRQHRFENENLLTEQITKDCKKAKQILARKQNNQKDENST